MAIATQTFMFNPEEGKQLFKLYIIILCDITRLEDYINYFTTSSTENATEYETAGLINWKNNVTQILLHMTHGAA